MENQHRHISGYRELGEAEIAIINRIKAQGEVIGGLLDDIEKLGTACDKRWLSIGRTNLQQGFMAVTRSVARPTTF